MTCYMPSRSKKGLFLKNQINFCFNFCVQLQPQRLNLKRQRRAVAHLLRLVQLQACEDQVAVFSLQGNTSCVIAPLCCRETVLSMARLTHIQDQPDNFTLATKLPCVVVRHITLPSLSNCNNLHMFFALETASTAATRTIPRRS
jgi:hypothetical protein